MNFALVLIAAVAGLAVGALAASLRARSARAGLEAELAAERERAAQQASRADELERQLEQAREEAKRLVAEVASQREKAAAEHEKATFAEKAREQMREMFKALASEALRGNAGEFTRQAKTNIEAVVNPLQEHVKKLEAQVHELEEKRQKAYGNLGAELRTLREMHQALQTQTTQLNQALRSSTARGQWGEVQLRRVVELAGMAEHVDFDEQASGDAGRPDMIVHLPGGAQIPIDAKAPLDAYLRAVETADPDERRKAMQDHARAMLTRVRDLSRKAYWTQFEQAPEFVVMFVPNEACLAAAFEADATLIDEAMKNRVLVCSPVNLLALLRTVQYGWQQHQYAENARHIAELGGELHRRLQKFLEHMKNVGSRLGQAVEAYNAAVGSYERRLRPKTQEFERLAGIDAGQGEEPERVDVTVRRLEAPDAQAESSRAGVDGPPADASAARASTNSSDERRLI